MASSNAISEGEKCEQWINLLCNFWGREVWIYYLVILGLLTSSHGFIWLMMKCFQLMLHVHIIMMIPLNRNHQRREMCTSKWFLSNIGWFYILLSSVSSYFYLIRLHQHQVTNSRWSVLQYVTLVLSFRLSLGICVHFGKICYMKDNWDAFDEMKMLIFCSPEWTILKKVESTVYSTFSAAC